MKMHSPLAASAALTLFSLLAACSSQSENVTSQDIDPDANKVAVAPPIELPPMMTASRTYRCKDNSLVYIDFFNNNTAVYKTDKAATGGTTLTSEGEGKPYLADGYSVSANSPQITLSAPGKGAQSCKG
jgi:hypothetical protein